MAGIVEKNIKFRVKLVLVYDTTVCGDQFHSPCICHITEILHGTRYAILVIKCLRTINFADKKVTYIENSRNAL